MDIINQLHNYRREENELKWEGTFKEYLELLKERKEVAQTAHSRIYEMIESAGVEKQNGRKVYQFFNEELFGLEESIERLVEEYFHPAAKRLDVKKRVLLLMGPVSGGNRRSLQCLNAGLSNIHARTKELCMRSRAVRCTKTHCISFQCHCVIHF